jgi:hypothetical protein
MGDAHGGFCLVDMLAARAGCAIDINAQILGPNFNIHFLRFRHYRDSGGRSMNPPLGFRYGNALYPVGARFILEAAIDAITGHQADDFLYAAAFRHRLAQNFNFPARKLGKTRIHAEKIASKKRGFLAARAGANFKNCIFLVKGILGQKGNLEVMFHAGNLAFQAMNFLMGHFPDFGILVFQEMAVILKFAAQFAMLAKKLDYGAQIRMSLGHLAVMVLIVEDIRPGQFFFKFQIFFFKTFKFRDVFDVLPRLLSKIERP